MKTRTKAAIGVIIAFAATLLLAPSAQAHAPISYVSDCPGTAVSQQLVIQTWSPDLIAVTAETPYPGGQIKPLGTAGPGDNGQVFYLPIQSADVVKWDLTSAGNTNYFFHTDCQY